MLFLTIITLILPLTFTKIIYMRRFSKNNNKQTMESRPDHHTSVTPSERKSLYLLDLRGLSSVDTWTCPEVSLSRLWESDHTKHKYSQQLGGGRLRGDDPEPTSNLRDKQIIERLWYN